MASHCSLEQSTLTETRVTWGHSRDGGPLLPKPQGCNMDPHAFPAYRELLFQPCTGALRTGRRSGWEGWGPAEFLALSEPVPLLPLGSYCVVGQGGLPALWVVSLPKECNLSPPEPPLSQPPAWPPAQPHLDLRQAVRDPTTYPSPPGHLTLRLLNIHATPPTVLGGGPFHSP